MTPQTETAEPIVWLSAGARESETSWRAWFFWLWLHARWRLIDPDEERAFWAAHPLSDREEGRQWRRV